MARRPRMNPRKTPRQSRSRSTVEAIVNATARVLVKEGYERATTNRVAQVAGVSIGSLYQYFPNKEALVLAVIQHHHEKTSAGMEARLVEMAQEPLPQLVREMVRMMIQAHATEPRLHKVLIEQVPRVGKMGKALSSDRFAELARQLMELRRAELRPGNLDLAVFIVVNAVEALTHSAVLERPELLSGEELVAEISELVLRYLQPPAQAVSARTGSAA